MIDYDLNLKSEKLTSVVKQMLIEPKLNYFGEFSLYINFHEEKVIGVGKDKEGKEHNIYNIPTAAVNCTRKGFNFYYNPEFINGMTDKENVFIMLHEICHLLFTHPKRAGMLNLDHKLANIAQDMIINTGICEDMSTDLYSLPEGLLSVPAEYDGARIFEVLYMWLDNKRDEFQQWAEGGRSQKGQGQGQQDPQDGDGDGSGKGKKKQKGQGKGSGQPEKNDNGDPCPVSDELKNLFDNYEDYQFDVHLADEVSDEIKKMLGEEITSKFKNRGLLPGNIEKMIEKLQKKKKDYLSEIKFAVKHISGIIKNKTYTRPNRKGLQGIKGKRKNTIILNALLDTSGSMGGDFEKVLSFIFQNNIEINLIQCDTQINNVMTIRKKKDFDKIVIKGLGGTELQPGFDYIKNSKELNQFNTVVLTDGYCDRIDASKMKKVLVLTTGELVHFTNNPASLKQIKIEKDM